MLNVLFIYSVSIHKDFYDKGFVIFLFRNYLKNGWCKEEFSQGYLEVVEGQDNFIILIMVDDIDADDLPDEMRKYVKTRTYLDIKDRDLFRKKLLYAMPHPPIKEFNIERDNAYSHLVPPLFNRVHTYRNRNKKDAEQEV